MSQAATVGPVEESVGYMLKKAASTLRSAMDAALRPLKLTVAQYSCLELLEQRPGLSGSELARATFVTRQSMNLVLQGLERRGLLARPAVPVRGKTLPTRLTPAGRRQLRAASEAVRVVEVRMLAGLTPTAERRLCQDLTVCVAALDEPPWPDNLHTGLTTKTVQLILLGLLLSGGQAPATVGVARATAGY